MRRTPGATGSSRPYSKAISWRNGMSTAMAGSPQDRSRAITAIPGRACRAQLPDTGWRMEGPHEDQARYRLHARGIAELFRPARCQADAGRAAQECPGAAERQSQNAWSGNHAEDLVAGRAQGLRAI